MLQSLQFEVSAALRFTVNRIHGQTDGHADGQCATLDAACWGWGTYRHSST